MISLRKLNRRQFLAESLAGTVGARGAWKGDPQVPNTDAGAHGKISLHVTGDAQQGFGTTLQYAGRPIARHNGGGEFSGVFCNGDRSLEGRAQLELESLSARANASRL